MQQDRNKSRRPSSSIQQNSARRQGKSRKAYDWTQDRRPSDQDRRRTQGYQEQTLDFSGGNVTFEKPQLRICGQQHPVSPADGATAQ